MITSQLPLLTLAIWVPIVFGLMVLVVGRDSAPSNARWLALIGALAGFVVTLPLVTGFDVSTAALQFVEDRPWIPAFNIRYQLGVDGIAMPFVVLNSFMTIFVVVAAWQVVTSRVSQYLAAFLVMSGLINSGAGAFVFLSFTNSMPITKPMPRTSPRCGQRFAASCKHFLMYAPIFAEFSTSGSFS